MHIILGFYTQNKAYQNIQGFLKSKQLEEKSMYTIIYEHQKWKFGVHQ